MKYNEIKEYAKKIEIKEPHKIGYKITAKIKTTIDTYNSAISNIQVGNIDIAIIKLKKVISLRPDFNEARDLLSILVDYENSKSYNEKHNEKKKSLIRKKEFSNSKKKTLPEKLNINPRTLIKIIVGIVILIIAIILIIVLTGTIKDNLNKKNTQEIVDNNNGLKLIINTLNNQIDELNSEIGNKNDDINANTTRIVVLEENISDYKNLLTLYTAKSFFSDGEYTRAAELIVTLENIIFEEEQMSIYNQVYSESMAESAKSVYNIGVNLFNQQNYEGALENLLLVGEYDNSFEEMAQVLYMTGKTYYELDQPAQAIEVYKNLSLNYPEFPNKDHILYNTGKAYMKLLDNTKAKEMFNLIISDYADSSLIGYARNKIKEIDGS